jgi:hypothetical protein
VYGEEKEGRARVPEPGAGGLFSRTERAVCRSDPPVAPQAVRVPSTARRVGRRDRASRRRNDPRDRVPSRDRGRVFGVITLGPYLKDVHFSDWDPAAWRRLPEQNEHMHWETVDPESCVPQGYAVVRCDSRRTVSRQCEPRLPLRRGRGTPRLRRVAGHAAMEQRQGRSHLRASGDTLRGWRASGGVLSDASGAAAHVGAGNRSASVRGPNGHQVLARTRASA